MYHPDDANIITTDDITCLRGVVLLERDDGTMEAILQLDLRQGKPYTTDNLKLHLTNGVSHRYLMVEPEEKIIDATQEETRTPETSAETAESGQSVEAGDRPQPDAEAEREEAEESAEKEPQATAVGTHTAVRVRGSRGTKA